jgi:hypothetical protein
VTYHPATALLLDPYNHFLSEGGNVWPRLKSIVEKVKAIDGTSGIGRPPAHRQDFEAGEALKAAPREAWRNPR